MSAKSVDLANEVVTILNNPPAPFEIAFTAVRRIAPFSRTELQGITNLLVLVFPGAVKASSSGTRRKMQRTRQVIIAVQKPLAGNDDESRQAEVDQLLGLCERIEELLEAVEPEDFSLQELNEEGDREPYNAGAMQAISFFSTAITLTYGDR